MDSHCLEYGSPLSWCQAFMAPLLNVKFPLLAGCNIRLSQYKHDASLAQLAREAALCTMGKDPEGILPTL